MPKKITNVFVVKIISSPKLLEELNKYLDALLVEEVKNETNRKMHALSKKWQAAFLDKTHDIFDNICKVIENDPKFKLPWTLNEVNSSIESIQTGFISKKL